MPAQDWFVDNAPKTAPPPSGDWFSKNAPVPSGTISQSRPEDEGNAFERFATRATGLPIKRIADDPNRYLNPLARSYWENRDDPAVQVPAPGEGPVHIPGSDTVRDLKAHNFAAAAGDVTPGALTAASLAASRFNALRNAAPSAPAMPAAMPKTAEAPMPASFQALKPPADVAPVPEQSQYPEGIQPRPTDRAEILDDKIARERAANDMGLQLYRAKREIGQESAPAPKWQQVAQAKADAIRAKAEADAQQVLADAEREATTSKTLTKTVTAKGPAAQEPIVTGLDANEDLTDILQRSLDAARNRKGK